MKIIELTTDKGKPVQINAKRIAWFQPVSITSYEWVTHVDFGGEWIVVKETPEEIRGLIATAANF